MAKKIIWSAKARVDINLILRYWLLRNKSNVYPIKLSKLINEAIVTISLFSFPRRKTDFNDIFVKTVRDYKIFFKEDDKTIFIIAIWDSRQDPENLKL